MTNHRDVDANLLVASQQVHQLTVIGPVRPDVSWQAHQATCPQGHRSSSWTPHLDAWGNHVIAIRFASKDCRRCPVCTTCTRAVEGARHIAVRPQKGHAALVQMRAQQETPEWKARYNRRAGIEGTLSQGMRVAGLRQARYVGGSQNALPARRDGCGAQPLAPRCLDGPETAGEDPALALCRPGSSRLEE